MTTRFDQIHLTADNGGRCSDTEDWLAPSRGFEESQARIFSSSRPSFRTSLLIIFCIILLTSVSYALEVPKLEGYVNDYADMISPQAKAELENELRSFEQTD